MTREEAIGVLEDVRDAICENIPGSHPELDELKEAVQMAVNALEERKTGKWIRGKCDQCGAHAPFWPMASTYYESDYCPNCGSDMRGEE